MRFEFDYDIEIDQITIVYDGAFTLTASYDGSQVSFKNFDRLDDEDLENILKNLCKSAFSALS
jgi:hypothetical protein